MPRTLSEIAQVNPQVNLPAGAVATTSVSFVPMSDVTESGDWIGRQVRKLGEVGNGLTVFADGDVLVAKITPCFENGKGAHVVGLTNGIGFGSTEFHVLRARDGVSPRYVHHVTQSARLRKAAEAYMSGSAGQRRVPREFFDLFNVPDHSPAEQQQIGVVLDTLDTTIRQTEAIIEKLKQVKQGMLHDLLTRGIDANGELRPPQSQAPHLYKDSPLGWIPREWDAIHMGEAIRELCQGWSPDCLPEPAAADQWGVLKTTAIAWDGYSDNQNKALPVTFRPRPDLEIAPEDILITRAGPKERVAVVAHVGHTRPGLMISDKMYRLRLRDVDIPAYFALALSSQYAQAAVTRTITGMAESQTNITQEVIRTLLVMCPPVDEQRAISLRVAVLGDRQQTEQAHLVALRSLKSGLMDDLLTGRVRVTPLLN
jgi:type I restriction enzyme, S subunit